jgi:hypothetical protein
VSVSAKEAFQLAFDASGGHERPVQWIKEDADNERVFFQIYSKLFPIDLSANVRGGITGRTCARRHALHVRAQQICSEHYWLAVYGFRGTFVGINNTRTPRPRTNRRGRGRGLHALFQDTFSDIEARLVTDSDATLEAICSNLVRPDAREFDVG